MYIGNFPSPYSPDLLSWILLVSKIEIEDEGKAVRIGRSDDKRTEYDWSEGFSECIYRLVHLF